VLLDDPQRDSHPIRLVVAGAGGLHLRRDVPVGFRAEVDVGLRFKRLGFALGTSLTPTGRLDALGPLRWWTELALTAGVLRAGDGPRMRVDLGVALRQWRDAVEPIGWTATPVVGASIGWGIALESRVRLVPRLWGQIDLTNTVISVQGEERATLFPLSGGLLLQFEGELRRR
jgi:hypothetical protein